MHKINEENIICLNCDKSHILNGQQSARTVDIIYEETTAPFYFIYNNKHISLLQCEIGCLLPCVKGLIVKE